MQALSNVGIDHSRVNVRGPLCGERYSGTGLKVNIGSAFGVGGSRTEDVSRQGKPKAPSLPLRGATGRKGVLPTLAGLILVALRSFEWSNDDAALVHDLPRHAAEAVLHGGARAKSRGPQALRRSGMGE